MGEILCGAPLRHFITLSVCAQQLGICTVYFSFVADNINAVVLGSAAQKANTDGSTSSSFIGHDTILGIFGSYHVVVTCVLPFALLLTFIPNLKQLAKVTEIATVFLFVTFALLVGVIIENLDGRRNRTEETNIYEIHWAMVSLAQGFRNVDATS